jgi:hypothetical protein
LSSDIESVPQFPVYTPGEDWQNLLENADEIVGYDLARDEVTDDLTGVPFLLTHVVFRPGVLRGKERAAYVSCEVRIAPALDIRLINTRREGSRLPRLSSLDDLPFGPNAHVIFNDGSTGVYRQVVKYLAMKRFIELPQPIVETGVYGESSFDQSPGKWTAFPGGTTADLDGFTGYDANVRLMCPRGLRLSLYENDYTQTGKTRYIA